MTKTKNIATSANIDAKAQKKDTEAQDTIDRLKLQYATIIDIGKASYDSFFKLGAMSFTLNGLLFTGLSYFFNNIASASNRFSAVVVVAISVIGVVYNMGAGCAFISLADLTASLQRKVKELDKQLGFEVAASRSAISNGLATASVFLTVLFFVLWIVAWLALVVWIVWHEQNLTSLLLKSWVD